MKFTTKLLQESIKQKLYLSIILTLGGIVYLLFEMFFNDAISSGWLNIMGASGIALIGLIVLINTSSQLSKIKLVSLLLEETNIKFTNSRGETMEFDPRNSEVSIGLLNVTIKCEEKEAIIDLEMFANKSDKQQIKNYFEKM